MSQVHVHATITARQFGLDAGDEGMVDRDAAAGYIAQGYLVILPDETAPTRKAKADPKPVEADMPEELTAEI